VPRYKISKWITAKNIKAAVLKEPTATSIELEEPEEKTPAIGFHIDQPYDDDADDEPDHGI
jgi:hypothetical protein